MSKIQSELCKAANVDPAKFKDRADLHAAIVKGVNALTDKEWEQLSGPAQDWFNDAADATRDRKAVKDFPDYEPERAPEEARSRRRSSSEETARTEAPRGESMAVEKLREGDRVKLVTKRGKTISGEVVEQNSKKEFVAIKSDEDGKEDEVDWSKVDSVEVFHGTAGTPAAAGPEVGDEVEFTTTRGKKVSGKVTELTRDTIVLDKTDDYDLKRIEGDLGGIKVTKSGGGSGASSSSGGSSRRSSSDDGKGADEDKKRSSNPRGVSVGGRVRELLGEDPDMSQEAIDKVLKKENIEFRDTSLNMIYRDSVALIKALREGGHMKK